MAIDQQEDFSKFNDGGKFRTAQGTDELSGVEGASLKLAQDTENLSDFEEGDELDVTIKGRVGAADEEGNIEITPITVSVKPMPGNAKMFRRDQKNSMPPPEAMKGDDEDM